MSDQSSRKMSHFKVLFIFCCIIYSRVGVQSSSVLNTKRGLFPDNFRWGFSTASYQIEGGWDADGENLHIIK
jgi:hypothetical protein